MEPAYKTAPVFREKVWDEPDWSMPERIGCTCDACGEGIPLGAVAYRFWHGNGMVTVCSACTEMIIVGEDEDA